MSLVLAAFDVAVPVDEAVALGGIVRVVGVVFKLVRSREGAVFLGERALVVERTRHRTVVAARAGERLVLAADVVGPVVVGVVEVGVGLVVAQPAEGREADEVEGVDFVAGLDREVVAEPFESRLAVTGRVVELVAAVGLGEGFRAASVAVGVAAARVAAREGKLANLRGEVDVAAESAAVVGVGTHAAHYAVGVAARHGDDVDDTAHALGLVFRRGVGDDFDILDRAGRHAFEHLFEVVARHDGRALAVEQHLVVALPVEANVLLGIDGNHGHLAQHVEGVVARGLGVGLHIVGNFINIALDERALGYDGHLRKFGPLGKGEVAQILGAFARFDGYLDASGCIAYRRDDQRIAVARCGCDSEVSVHVRGHPGQHFAVVVFHPHGDEGDSLLAYRIGHGTAYFAIDRSGFGLEKH